MPETASTLAAWRIGGQIDESALTGISQYADIEVTATLVGATGQNVVDPTNQAHDLRGPYVTIVGGVPGTATTKPTVDGNATLAGRLWWTEPLKATGAVDPNAALQPSGLAWQIVVKTTTRRGDVHTLATFTVGIEGDRNYTTEGETILVPSGAGGADEPAIGVGYLTEPPATVADNTFEARVLDVIADNGITGTPELPVGGTLGQALVKASATDYDVTWDTIVGGGSGTLPPGFIDGGDFVDPAKFALWNGSNGHVSMADGDSTADFQALFDHVASLALAGLGGGVTVLVPRGRYLLTGSVLIPDMTSTFQMVVDMTGVFVLHKPQGGVGNSMFRTGLPAGPLSAEAANDVRNLWTFRGGYFDGDTLPGQIAFEWNAVSRLVMERMHIQSFEIGIRGRFMLHFLLRDSSLQNNKLYQIQIAASGASDSWSGATPSNAASNGTIIQNVRFFGVATQIAQVRISHSSHTIRDCTFEGAGPANTADGGGYNIMYVNDNTSCMTSKAENLWLENNPAVADFFVDASRRYSIDLQHSSGGGLIADIRRGVVTIYRVPYPPHIGTGFGPLYKVNGADRNSVRIEFVGTGDNDGCDIASTVLWADDVLPGSCTNHSANIVQTIAYDRRVYQLDPPDSNSLALNATTPALWTVKRVGI